MKLPKLIEQHKNFTLKNYNHNFTDARMFPCFILISSNRS